MLRRRARVRYRRWWGWRRPHAKARRWRVGQELDRLLTGTGGDAQTGRGELRPLLLPNPLAACRPLAFELDLSLELDLPFPLTVLGPLLARPVRGRSRVGGRILVVQHAPARVVWTPGRAGSVPLIVLVIELAGAAHPSMLVEVSVPVQYSRAGVGANRSGHRAPVR
jgi:hypothetical protein